MLFSRWSSGVHLGLHSWRLPQHCSGHCVARPAAGGPASSVLCSIAVSPLWHPDNGNSGTHLLATVQHSHCWEFICPPYSKHLPS